MSETGPTPPEPADLSDAEATAAERDRRRKLAAAFEGPLPEGTKDESGEAWGERDGGRDEDWFRSQVPPHHG